MLQFCDSAMCSTTCTGDKLPMRIASDNSKGRDSLKKRTQICRENFLKNKDETV